MVWNVQNPSKYKIFQFLKIQKLVLRLLWQRNFLIACKCQRMYTGENSFFKCLSVKELFKTTVIQSVQNISISHLTSKDINEFIQAWWSLYLLTMSEIIGHYSNLKVILNLCQKSFTQSTNSKVVSKHIQERDLSNVSNVKNLSVTQEYIKSMSKLIQERKLLNGHQI